MKAALRTVACLMNMSLFLLSASNTARLAVLLTTLGAWWWLSDYFFAPWPWWMDRYAFILCSFFVFLVMTAAVLWLGIRRRSRRLAPSFDLLRGSETKLSIQDWCELLRAVAGLRGGLWARYYTWYRLRLESMRLRDEMFSVDSLPTLWWLHPGALPEWLALGCLPALWALLLLAPLHTNVTERLASIVDTQPQVIYDVRCVGVTKFSSEPRRVSLLGTGSRAHGMFAGEAVQETLEHGTLGFQRNGRCAFLADGSFEVSSTPFPRVYRLLVIKCRGRCDVLPRDGAAALLTYSVPVVSGEASFRWLQTSPDPALGMMVSLVRQDGTTLDKVSIEP